MIKVHIADDFMIDGLAIYISLKTGEGDRVLRLHDPDTREWEPIAPGDSTAPTLKLTGEEARALLDALLRYYEGASDMRTVRSDLLHERGRVDVLTGALIKIITYSTEGLR